MFCTYKASRISCIGAWLNHSHVTKTDKIEIKIISILLDYMDGVIAITVVTKITHRANTSNCSLSLSKLKLFIKLKKGNITVCYILL